VEGVSGDRSGIQSFVACVFVEFYLFATKRKENANYKLSIPGC